jgi:Transposase DDE domain group 1
MGAYWLLHELKGAAPKRSIWRTATFETIRCALLKIAVRIQELKTRIKMALPSAYPYSLRPPSMISSIKVGDQTIPICASKGSCVCKRPE